MTPETPRPPIYVAEYPYPFAVAPETFGSPAVQDIVAIAIDALDCEYEQTGADGQIPGIWIREHFAALRPVLDALMARYRAAPPDVVGRLLARSIKVARAQGVAAALQALD